MLPRLGPETLGGVTAPLIPHEVLWTAGGRDNLQISADGSLLAWLEMTDGVSNLVVRPVDGGEARQLTRHATGHGVENFCWAGESQHLVVSHDNGGDEDYQLDVVDLTTGEVRPLVAQAGVRALLLGVDARQPGRVAIGLNADDPAWHDFYVADARTAQLEKVAVNPGFARWIADSRLQPLGGARPLDDGGAEVCLRDGDGWRTVLSVGPDDAFALLFDVFPAWGDDDGAAYVCTSYGQDTMSLLRIDPGADAEITPIATHPTADILELLRDGRGRPLDAGFPAARLEHLVIAPEVADDIELLGKELAGDWTVLSSDAADMTWTLREARSDASTAYHLYRRAERELTPVFTAAPELDEAPLALMEPFSFRARDGLEIHGYLTYPVGGGRTALPTVVMVHGGPANRYFWGYDPQVQFFANRGYLVAQVNFRGSIGYGKQFLAAGDRQWARAMHTDIVDAVEWLGGPDGPADRDRIALWGTSYGGYECLVSVTHDPDLVRCAIPVVAPVNLITLLENIPAYWRAERAYLHRAIGEDPDDLWDRSPLRLADRIRVPLLLFYGAMDPRVKPSEAEQLASVLDKSDIPYELHILPGEGHNLRMQMTVENRTLYVERLEAFLTEHLAAR